MFDRFMQQTLPLWFLATMIFALVVAGVLIRAALRIRHLRALLNEATREANENGRGPAHPWQSTESRDWVAQR
jgi:hypothetical protein